MDTDRCLPGRCSRCGWAAGRSGRDDCVVMAIVNRTPDSFFDRGATFAEAAALRAVDAAVAEGADIVDIGGVKAGPGDDVDAAEEIAPHGRRPSPRSATASPTW